MVNGLKRTSSSGYRDRELAVPVLLYHQVLGKAFDTSRRRGPYVTSVEDFAGHLRVLREDGFLSLTARELLNVQVENWSSATHKLVVITFDDGYLDNYLYAFPVLRQTGFKATIFVIVNKVGRPGFVGWEHLREMQDCGISIQSHTLNHQPLATLSDTALERELLDSRLKLEDELQASVDWVSYPHGSYDKRVIRAAAEAGYVGACTSDFGYFTFATEPHRVRRIVIRSNYDALIFRKIVLGRGMYVVKLKIATGMLRLMARIIGIKNYQFLHDIYYGKKRGTVAQRVRI